MAGTGKGGSAHPPAPPGDVPNDEQEYHGPAQADLTYYPAPGHPDYTRYYLTIPTGWHIDATQALRDTMCLPPTDDSTRHIANHEPTRIRELLNMRAPFLHVLRSAAMQEITDRTASLPPPTTHPTPDDHTDLIDMMEASIHNPYAGLATIDDELHELGPLTHPPTCTLVLNVDPIGPKAPLLAPMRRQGLPHMFPTSLSIQGLRLLAHTTLTEAHRREHQAPRGGKP